jgi:hypothetical protein
MKAYAIGVILAILLFIPHVSSEAVTVDYIAAIHQYFKVPGELIPVGATLDAINRAWNNGFNLSEAFDYAGTTLYCPIEFPISCESSNGSYMLTRHRWISGCRGYSKDCCEPENMSCRVIMMAEDSSLQHDVEFRDNRVLCLENNCMPQGGCIADAECSRFITCPMFFGDGPTAMCDVTLGVCYCGGGTCGDGICTYWEATRRTCLADCGEIGLDSDGDGLSDWDEINIYGTDPFNPDTDGDGWSDWHEVMMGTDPLNPDTDRGGQCDGSNAVQGVCRTGPDPCPFDSSNLCYAGIGPGQSPLVVDMDDDGLANYFDPCPTDPLNRCRPGNDPDISIAPGGIPLEWGRQHGVIDPEADSSNSGLTNLEEYLLGFHPLLEDSSGNGLPDYWVAEYGVSDPEGDSDNDGLTNIQEYHLGTDPTNPDTLGNGILDGDEYFVPTENATIIVELLAIDPQDSNPTDGIYMLEYGDTLKQIAIEAKYSDGVKLVNPLVIGQLSVQQGRRQILIDFERASDMVFVSKPSYDILKKNDEGPHISLELSVIDAYSEKSADLHTRFFILNIDDDEFRIEVNSPEGMYAYGQYLDFDVSVFGTKEIGMVSTEVFVEGTNRSFTLSPSFGSLAGRYRIKADDPNPLFFLVYSSLPKDERYDSIRRSRVDINPVLTVNYLPDSSTPEFHAFEIAYPNLASHAEEQLSGTANSEAVLFIKNPMGLYESKFDTEGNEDVFIELSDSFGNTGRTRVASGLIRIDIGIGDFAWPTVLAIFAAAMVIVLYRFMGERRKKSGTRKSNEKDLMKKKTRLEGLIQSTKTRYYKKTLSQEYASQKIAEYEEELKLVEGELAEIAQQAPERRKKRHPNN